MGDADCLNRIVGMFQSQPRLFAWFGRIIHTCRPDDIVWGNAVEDVLGIGVAFHIVEAGEEDV